MPIEQHAEENSERTAWKGEHRWDPGYLGRVDAHRLIPLPVRLKEANGAEEPIGRNDRAEGAYND